MIQNKDELMVMLPSAVVAARAGFCTAARRRHWVKIQNLPF